MHSQHPVTTRDDRLGGAKCDHRARPALRVVITYNQDTHSPPFLPEPGQSRGWMTARTLGGLGASNAIAPSLPMV